MGLQADRCVILQVPNDTVMDQASRRKGNQSQPLAIILKCTSIWTDFKQTSSNPGSHGSKLLWQKHLSQVCMCQIPIEIKHATCIDAQINENLAS